MANQVGQDRSETLEKLLSGDSSTRVDSQLHLTDLLINILHEENDKVHQLPLVHRVAFHVGNQERNVVTL